MNSHNFSSIIQNVQNLKCKNHKVYLLITLNIPHGKTPGKDLWEKTDGDCVLLNGILLPANNGS